MSDEIFKLANWIASEIFPDDKDLNKCTKLREFLIAFAEEIKHGSIEP